MNRVQLQRYILALLPALLLAPWTLHAQSETPRSGDVYVIEITHEVDLGLPPYVRRVFEEAAEHKAAAVVLRINTFGGRVDVATEIKDAVLNSRIPTIAFIDKRAISAGALIALSSQKIVMTPGGTIGAATPVYETGEKASEKVVSYMRSEMRATAEKHGRDPRIAEAMVDEKVDLGDSIDGGAGTLLTLTTAEAKKVGYCDAEAATLEAALDSLGYRGARIVQSDLSWGEDLVRFFTSPVMSSILIMLGLGGLFYGVKTGHMGTVAAIGIGAMTLFFGAQYLVDLANAIEVLMFVAGVVLLLVEVFVIPGFGVVGILGIVMMFASLFMALIGNFDLVESDSLTVPLYTLAASMVGLAVLVALIIKYLPSSSVFRRFALESIDPTSGHMLAADYLRLVNEVGEAMTTLRPAGTALIGVDRFDVITDGEFINAGEQIRVVRVEGRKIVVRRQPQEEGPVNRAVPA